MAYAAAALKMYSSIAQNNAEGDAAKFDANMMNTESRAAWGQTVLAEGAQRNASREAVGKQAAAYGAAGVGYGGSSEGAMRQSITNQEMDALNVRYRGALTAWGYKTQSYLDMRKADALHQQGNLSIAQQLIGSATKNPMNWSNLFKGQGDGSAGGLGAGMGNSAPAVGSMQMVA